MLYHHLRINESLFALALVEPTQYTTQLACWPDTWCHLPCPSHHACHLRSLAELSSSSAPLWRMAAGAVSGSQHTGIGSAGGTSRSALGAIKAVGGVDELEQPAIRNAAMHNRVFDPFTVNHLSLGHLYGDPLHDERLSCGQTLVGSTQPSG